MDYGSGATSWFPLSIAQRSRCFAYELEPRNRGNHNNVFVARLRGPIQPAVIESALRGLIARHPMLRAEVSIEQGQRILAEMPFALEVVAADGMDADALRMRVQTDAWAPFLRNGGDGPGPLLRACLYVTGATESVMLLALDHMVCDGWSYWHLLDELGTALSGVEVSAPETAAATYRDYVLRQQDFVHGPRGARQLAHWQNVLAGDGAPLRLPFDRPRPAQSSSRQGFVTRRLGRSLKERLQSGSADEGATLYNQLLVTLQILLHRYTGQDRIVIGAAVPGRSQPAWKSVVGDFANVLAMRADFDAQPTARAMLRNCQRALLSALRNQDYPFPLLVEKLGIAYSDENPLYQVSFVFQKPRRAGMLARLWNEQDSDHDAPRWGDLTLHPFPIEQRVGQDNRIALTLHAVEIDDDARCDFAYDVDVFDAATVERMADHFMALLEGIAANPDRTARQLPLLSEPERRRLLVELNAAPLDHPEGRLIHEPFEQAAAAQPDEVAVVVEDCSLTYAELNARANQLAHELMALGVRPDDRVAICVERSLEMVVGLLGILKAGGAFVPLDPAHPVDRLRSMLHDAAPRALLTQQALRPVLTATERPMLLLDGDAFAGRSTENPDARAQGLNARNLAYVIYTSGSTGTPKGVMIEHRSAINLWQALERLHFVDPGARARIGLNASIGFDGSLKSLLQLLSGHCVVVFPQRVRADAEAFLRYAHSHALDAFDCTPAQLALLLRAGLADEGAAWRPKAVLVGGERIGAALWHSLKAVPTTRFFNVYGPTECTVDATACALREAGDRPVIGRPLGNVAVYVLDAHREPVPLGVEGELYVGGVQVARGYLNRPEWTAERFLPDPFCGTPNARMYKTGDLGRWLPDGTIEYLGRNDFQVKIRGFRIELGEIEAKLAHCAGVREVAVVAREDAAGDSRLVAYLVARDGATLEPAALRAALQSQLPEYMLPSAFVLLDAFPLTPNGKLDRKALPAPEATALIARAYEAPRGEIEEKLAALWRDLLRVESVGRHDPFFELGGHSLLAMQLISHIRAAFGVELPLRELFANTTVSALAEAVRAARASTMGQIQRADRTQPLPLSMAQQRLWFLDQLDKAASAAYHMPAALRLRGRLDVAALQAALDRLIARHESLRTTFIAMDGLPYQRIAPENCGFALVREDLSALPAGEREAAVARQSVDEGLGLFDLSAGPLARGRLLRLGDDEHVLLVTQHHIITDGWSIDVMVRELAALYAAFHNGQSDPLPPLEIQYADYAQWQRGWLRGEELARQLEFWKSHLSGAPALLELPLDRPRPAVQSHAGGIVPVLLSPELTASLRELSQRHGVTPYMTLLAAWGVLLSRLSGQQDVVVGTPVANRQRREFENLIGFFVNMLAVRLRLDENPTVASLLAGVKETALAAFAHQELPFEQLVEAAQPQRSLSHSPLAQVTFTWNNLERARTDGGSLSLPGLEVAVLDRAHQTIQVDLQLLLDDGEDVISGVLVYAQDLFDRQTALRWTGHFVRLLEAMAADASMAVAALPMLSATEREQVLETFNRTGFELPREALIHQLFEQQAARRPDAVAVIDDGGSLSYGELNTRANRLAHYLIGLGVKRDDRVAICSERNADLIAAFLGILKAGGAYVPLDPTHPRERLAWMLEDCEPVALLIQSEIEELLPETELPVLRLDVDLPVLAQRLPTHDPDAPLSPNDLAYVIYTSGSTGTPKGVMVEQKDVVALVRAPDYVALDRSSIVAQASNASFDAATFEIWGALLNGGRLVIVDKETLIDPARLKQRLVAERVDTLFITTALFNRIAGNDPSVFATLGTLLFGGEKVAPEMVAVVKRGFPGRLLHVYGPTENTTFSTWYHVLEAPQPGAATVPIGRGLAGARLYVLDSRQQPVPIGVAGEIHVGGAGVARGYLGRPELTAERFVSDPFDGRPCARMYKTGDLGRWLPDGNIEFLGRDDFQVKIRGFRVELGEIEARLRLFPRVRDAAVLAREDAPGDKRLVAYLVAEDDAELSASALRDGLSRQLPDYMVPSAFVQLDVLPLNANGKLDRRALPPPEAAALSLREYEAPRGEIEEAIAALWREQLNVPRVGRDDNFFELGGHSLLAVQLISHIRATLGVEVPLRELFAAPSLAALAEAVRAAGASTMGGIARADRDQPLRLSLAQQRLWFLAQLDEAASAAHHIPAALRLRGRLDVDALHATLDRVVARHEVLRTRFIAIDGVPYQQIAPADCGFALQREDLRALPLEEREAAVARLSSAEARAPFDLSAGPLIRGRLLCVSDDDHVLLVTQHHIVSDGWSLGVLVREVAALYTAFRRGESDPLPPLAVQYADYAQWQHQWLQGEELARQLDFWRDHLAGAPTLLDLPLDRPRPSVQSHSGDSVPVTLSGELTAALRELSQRHGVTLFMTLFAGWGLLLSRLSGQKDVVVGTPVANRQRREVEDLIGFFINTLALRLRFDGPPTVASLLAQLRETTLAAFAHQELPFEQVVEALQPKRDLGHSPLAQSHFSFDNLPNRAALRLPGLQLELLENASATAQNDFSVQLSDTGEVLSGIVVYANDLFDRATAERWAGYYVRLLEAMAADASASVETLPLLSEDERRQLLSGFNATKADYPRNSAIHELFGQQAAARSDATAVICGERRLTYGELNEKADRLCRYLRELGAGPETRIGLYLERSVEMLIAVLGTLKSGAAYVPLSPDAPEKYTSHQLQDAGIDCVLLSSEHLSRTLSAGRDVVLMDGASADEQWLADYDDGDPAVAGDPERLAYVLYTSGSTGLPKGVAVTHRAAVNYLHYAATQYLPDVAGAVVSSPLSFDATLTTLMAPWLAGKPCLLLPEDMDRMLPHLLACFRGTEPLLFKLTPAHLELLASLAERPIPGIAHRVVVGGEQLSRRLLRRFTERVAPDAIVVNEYGPTETVVGCTTYVAAAHDCDVPSIAVPIGKPVANAAIYILDAQGEPVPLGVAGEIYIGGVGVARGYLNRAELTAERFLHDPFSGDPNARMYKTGDLARRLPDGNIEYLGRNDLQVKIRGFRIELGEVEAKLRQCAGVRDTVVVAREDGPGHRRLVAYVVAETALPTAGLRDQLSKQLPEHMVPSAFVVLDALPLTANGKLDRNALPAPDGAALLAQEYAPPQGRIEEALAAIWGELLNVERVGRHDQFFALGGHSLLAVQLLSRIRATLGAEIALRDLFAQPSLQALAEAVRRAGATAMADIAVADRGRSLPLSLAQQRLWFLDRLDRAASAAYHLPAALRLRGKLDVAALQATLDRVVARHESLRTSFAAIDGVPYQHIAPAGCGFALTLRDLCALDLDSRERAVRELAAEEASTPFDLTTGPLIRGQLLALAVDEHVLLMTQHHIVTDGWSLGILVREVAALYMAYSRGDADPLPPLEIQYADYAQWQRQWLRGEELTRQSEFWKAHLAGAPALLELPLDRPRPAVQRHSGSSVPLVLSAKLAANLRAFSRHHGATPFMTLLAAWGLLLSRLSGQQDVVIGTPVANRQRREVEDLIGFFVNTLALRLRFDDSPTVASLLAQVRDTTLAALAHQELPFEQVVEAVQPQRSLSHSPLFQAMFALNNTVGYGDALSLPGLSMTPVELEQTTALYELSLHLNERDDEWSGVLLYASDLFDRATVERWAGAYIRLLEAMVADTAAGVDTLPLLSPAERRQLLVDFNATALEYPKDVLIHELFERQAAAQPDAVAVALEGQSITYAELNGWANRLAHELLALGVRPDDRVAICTERGLEMIVGLLGILKAGGAYLPLDPAYPNERLQYLLGDAAPKVVLTQQVLQQQRPPADRPVLLLDSEELRIRLAARPASNPRPRELGLTPQHLAYVIYTSGSTGLPKGVAIEHVNTANLLHWALTSFTKKELSNTLFSTSINFDLAAWELFVPLAAGATLTLVRNALSLAARPEPVTLINTVPSAIKALLDAGGVPASARMVNLAGETLKREIVERLFAETATESVANLYGPSETTTYSTWVRMQRADGFAAHIGRPVANTQVYILDAHREPVPMGVTGEIYIGGDGVARGYLNRPELTAECFLRDPFRAQPNARMYKTGDLGRWLPDGNIEYLGRNDFQVKIRGFRIELGEIEAKLGQCAGVREAAVMAREDAAGDKRLVAYLVAADGVAPAAAELRTTLLSQLPDFMVPSAFVQLDALPLTPNGKLDRNALPAPEATALIAREYEAPEGEVEEQLAAIWKRLLRVEHVGRRDNFFELGGHSLLAVQLQARISDELLVDVPLRALMVAGDLQGLAGEVAALQFDKFLGEEMGDHLSAMSADELKALLESENLQ